MTVSVVFLAAGLSTRYRRPKQLEPVGPNGESLLDYGVYDALRGGADHLVMVTREALLRDIQDHLDQVFGAIPVTFVLQDASGGAEWRPRGTGHAVLAATDAIEGHFAVGNADDFYGAGAWAAVIGALKALDVDHVMVGYPLSATLSASGGVSRALCQVGEDGLVSGMVEWRDVIPAGDSVEGTDLSGNRAMLDPNAWVSMNLWGFAPTVLPTLQEQYDSLGHRDAEEEFLLSTAIDDQLRRGRATLRLLPTDSEWFGLTHPADLATVQSHLRRLTDRAVYPSPLGSHLSP